MNRKNIFDLPLTKPQLLLILWALWLTIEYFGLGPFSYVRVHDWGDSNLPMILGLKDQVFNHGLSYWFEYATGGVDRLAFLLANFRIQNLFFFVLPGWLAGGLFKLLQVFFAGFFTYKLSKDKLKISKGPAILTGLIYSISFSHLIYDSAHHAMIRSGILGPLGLPLVIWFLERINKKSKTKSYLLAGGLGVFTFLTSSIHKVFPFMFIVIVVWFIVIKTKSSWKFWTMLGIYFGTYMVVTLPNLLAMLHNAYFSHRSDLDRTNPLWGGFFRLTVDAAKRSLSFFKNNALLLIPGSVGLVWNRFKDKRLVWITVGLVFCGMAWFIRPLKILLQPYLGFFSGYQFSRFYVFAPFFLAIFVGYGIDKIPASWVLMNKKLPNPKEWDLRTIVVLLVCVFLLFHSVKLKYSHARKWVTGNSYAVNYQNKQMKNLAAENSNSPYRVATIAGRNLHPAFANAYGLETADGYVTLYPQTYQDYWGKVIEPLTSEDQNRYNYFQDWGNRVYLFSPSDGFGSSEKIDFSEYYNLNLLSLANVKYIVSPKPVTSDSLKLWSGDLLNNRIDWDGLSTLGKIKRGFANNFTGRELYIYENENYLPRFFLVDSVQTFKKSAQMLDVMVDSSVERLSHTAFMNESEFSSYNIKELGFESHEIKVKQNTPDKIKLEVSLEGSGLLVITQNYSPFWKCEVDEEKREVFPVYHTFTGIVLEDGNHDITFSYDPPYWPPY